jgi:hypothetical protein
MQDRCMDVFRMYVNFEVEIRVGHCFACQCLRLANLIAAILIIRQNQTVAVIGTKKSKTKWNFICSLKLVIIKPYYVNTRTRQGIDNGQKSSIALNQGVYTIQEIQLQTTTSI